MKHVIHAVLLALAWLCVSAEGRLSAQQVRLPDESIVADQPEVIPSGAPLSAKLKGSRSKSPGTASKPAAGSTAQGVSPDGARLAPVSSEDPATGYLAASPPLDQTAVYNGGVFGPSTGTACELCGEGSQTPPAWYVHQGAQFMQRSGPPQNQRKPLVGWFASQDDPNTLTTDVPHWVQTQANTNLYTWVDTRAVTPVFSTRTLGFDTATGYAVTVGHYLGRDTDNRDHFVEFSYAGMNKWLSETSINGVVEETYFSAVDVTAANRITNIELPDATIISTDSPRVLRYVGSLASPYALIPAIAGQFTDAEQSLSANFNQVTNYHLVYRSIIDGDMELNARIQPRGRADRLVLLPNGRWQRQCQPGHQMSYLFGLRFMSIDESFGLGARGVVNRPLYDGPKEIGTLPDTVTGYEVLGYSTYNQVGDYYVQTHNDLFGAQVGGELALRRCKWTAGARGKVGPYINFSDQATRITAAAIEDVNPFDAHDPNNQHLPAVDIERFGENEGLSIIGEFGFFGSYKIRPNLVATAGYDMRWVSGLALAPGQVTFQPNPPNAVNTQGFTFYQALTVGLECMW